MLPRGSVLLNTLIWCWILGKCAQDQTNSFLSPGHLIVATCKKDKFSKKSFPHSTGFAAVRGAQALILATKVGRDSQFLHFDLQAQQKAQVKGNFVPREQADALQEVNWLPGNCPPCHLQLEFRETPGGFCFFTIADRSLLYKLV